MKRMNKIALLILTALCSSSSFAFFLTGEGHYGLRPEFRTKPNLKGGANYFGVTQSFRLLTEIRAHERTSFFTELRLFTSEREATLGKSLNNGTDDEKKRQIFNPVYRALSPRITKAYLRYTTDYVIIEAGRRSRSWAQGLLYDAGEKPFDTYASVFDGITAYLNPSKSQSLGFMGGYDIIHDTPDTQGQVFHQVFGAVYYDTEKLKNAGPIASNTGLYLGHMFDTGQSSGVAGTSVSFFDAYFNFAFQPINLVWKNELLGVWGKAGSGQAKSLGGRGEPGKADDMGSVSIASHLAWTFFQSGAYRGPKEFNEGDYKRSLVFFDFVFLPGAAQGALSEGRKAKGSAFRANENFKKTLILFNSHQAMDGMETVNVDGIFDPYRMMNVMLYSFGARYEDLKIGNFEGRFTHARLSQTHEEANKIGQKANGASLGFEADVSYSINFGKNLTVGADLGVFVPGNAFKSADLPDPATSFLAQASVIFKL